MADTPFSRWLSRQLGAEPAALQTTRPLDDQERRQLDRARQEERGRIVRARARRAFRRLPLPAKLLLMAAGAYLAALNFAVPIYCATKPSVWVLKRGGWADLKFFWAHLHRPLDKPRLVFYACLSVVWGLMMGVGIPMLLLAWADNLRERRGYEAPLHVALPPEVAEVLLQHGGLAAATQPAPAEAV